MRVLKRSRACALQTALRPKAVKILAIKPGAPHVAHRHSGAHRQRHRIETQLRGHLLFVLLSGIGLEIENVKGVELPLQQVDVSGDVKTFGVRSVESAFRLSRRLFGVRGLDRAFRLLSIENQTQKKIQLVENYVTYDPRSSFDFYSLCSLWFYYDSEDRLIDVEWEYYTD